MSFLPDKIGPIVDYSSNGPAEALLKLMDPDNVPSTSKGLIDTLRTITKAGMSDRANQILEIANRQKEQGVSAGQILENLKNDERFDANDLARADIQGFVKKIRDSQLQENAYSLGLMQQQKARWELEAQEAAAKATDLYHSTGAVPESARPIFDSIVKQYGNNPLVRAELLKVLPKEGLGTVNLTEDYSQVDPASATALRQKAKIFDNFFKRLGIERDAEGNLISKSFRERAQEYFKTLGFDDMDFAHGYSKALEAYNAARNQGFTDAVAADAVFRNADPRSIVNPARWFGSAIDFDIDDVLTYAKQHKNDPIYEIDAENIIKLLAESKDLDKLIINYQDKFAENTQKVLNSALSEADKKATLVGMRFQDKKFNKTAAALLKKLDIATKNLDENKLKEMYPYLF